MNIAFKLTLCLTLGSASAAAGEVVIAIVAPLSGGQADFGSAVLRGVQLALEEQRAAFKLAGLDVRWSVYDDQADAATSTASLRRALTDRRAIAVIGPLNTGTALAAATVFDKSNVAVLSPTATPPERSSATRQPLFFWQASEAAVGRAGGLFLADELKAKRVVIVTADGWSRATADAAERTLQSRGVGTERASSRGPRPANGVDAVYFVGDARTAREYRTTLREAGVRVPMVLAWLYDPNALWSVDNGLEDVWFTSNAVDARSTERVRRVLEKANAGVFAGEALAGYDAANAVSAALLKARSDNRGQTPSRVQVRNALAKMQGTTAANEVYSFNARGERTPSVVYVRRLEPNGSSTVVKTVQVRE